MRLIYATDLHGKKGAIRALFEEATLQEAEIILLGGDITPKNIAILLPLIDSQENGQSKGGEILPLDMLNPGSVSKTYTENLLQIKRLNDRIGRENLLAHFENQGYIIHKVSNAFFDFDSLLQEQELLEKLCIFFDRDLRPKGDMFSEMDYLLLNDCVIDWFMQYENQWEEKAKNEFVRKYQLTFSEHHVDFESIAPSKNLVECILSTIYPKDMMQCFQNLEDCTSNPENLLQEYFARLIRKELKKFSHSSAYKNFISPRDILNLVKFTSMETLIEEAESCTAKQQGLFLQDFLFPMINDWKAKDLSRNVVVMLGNDDFIENENILREAHANGILINITDSIQQVNDFQIAGYSFVESLPSHIKYREKVRDQKEIYNDLKAMNLSADEKLIWVIHNPPYQILDEYAEGQHAGSHGVLQFIEEFSPRLCLFGHIHEARMFNPSGIDQVGSTICINPGGQHNEKLDAALIDTDTDEIEMI